MLLAYDDARIERSAVKVHNLQMAERYQRALVRIQKLARGNPALTEIEDIASKALGSLAGNGPRSRFPE